MAKGRRGTDGIKIEFESKMMGIMSLYDNDANGWTVQQEANKLHLLITCNEIAASDLETSGVEGFQIIPHLIDGGALSIDAIGTDPAIVAIEIDDSSNWHGTIAALLVGDHSVIALLRDGKVSLIRQLLQLGVKDVLGLPLQTAELKAALEQIRDGMNTRNDNDQNRGKIISVIRSVGGVGATMIATQAASMQAERDRDVGRDTCLIDLDLQFGNAATYLGIQPPLTIKTLFDAGIRIDRALVRSVAARAPGGAHVIAAPSDIAPLEEMNAEQLIQMVDMASQEFSTVYLDMPASWTNWSLSLIARSDLVILVIELTIASLRQARRQLELLAMQGLSEVPVMVVVNRVQKKLFKPIDLGDAERAIGHPVSISITNDFPLVSTALDQGVSIQSLQKGSKVAKDIEGLIDACAAQWTERNH